MAAVATRPSSSTETGNHSPIGPARCGEPRVVRKSSASVVSAGSEGRACTGGRRRAGSTRALPPRTRRWRPGTQRHATRRAGATGGRRAPSKSMPAGDEQERDQQRGDRALVEAVQHVQRADGAEQHERELPGAVLPARQAARDEQQGQPERRRRARARAAGRPPGRATPSRLSAVAAAARRRACRAPRPRPRAPRAGAAHVVASRRGLRPTTAPAKPASAAGR